MTISKFRKAWQAVTDVVAVPRLALEVMVGEVNAAIERAVRRLGYNVPTMEQKGSDAATAFVSGRDVFVFLPSSGTVLRMLT